jgi:Uma2 family endonuclease
MPEIWPHGISRPPSVDELVTDDGEPMESARHRDQMFLLIESLALAWKDRDDFYVGGNMFLYFSALQAKRNDFRGPDVFVVLRTHKHERKAWVVWEEDGKTPDVVIELLSDTTAQTDRTEKMRVYESVLRVPEYFWYDPFTQELAGFVLRNGRYEPIAPNASGRLPSRALGLELGIRTGTYLGNEAPWLRWFLPSGEVLPTRHEAAAEAERARDEARRHAAALEARLAELTGRARDES